LETKYWPCTITFGPLGVNEPLAGQRNVENIADEWEGLRSWW